MAENMLVTISLNKCMLEIHNRLGILIKPNCLEQKGR